MIVRGNDLWLADLRSGGSRRDEALTDLHAEIRSGLPFGLQKWIDAGDARFNAFIEETAQETLLRVLAHLDDFQGRSQFTTWVHSIAVRVALSELRRSRWEEISLDKLLEGDDSGSAPRDFAEAGSGTEERVEQAALLELVDKIIQTELSEKQRRALLAAVGGMPSEAVAAQMQMERNALYKLVHDARLKLKKKLEEEGLSTEDILAAFEPR